MAALTCAYRIKARSMSSKQIQTRGSLADKNLPWPPRNPASPIPKWSERSWTSRWVGSERWPRTQASSGALVHPNGFKDLNASGKWDLFSSLRRLPQPPRFRHLPLQILPKPHPDRRYAPLCFPTHPVDLASQAYRLSSDLLSITKCNPMQGRLLNIPTRPREPLCAHLAN